MIVFFDKCYCKHNVAYATNCRNKRERKKGRSRRTKEKEDEKRVEYDEMEARNIGILRN
jgi:hypothetical protein